jgi:hypothetical protein
MTRPKELKIGDKVRIIDHSGGIPDNIKISTVTSVGSWGSSSDNVILDGRWSALRRRLRKLPDKKEGA